MPMTREITVTTSAALTPSRGETPSSASTSSTTTYHTIAIGNINIFYREAGPRGAPTLLLLHRYPSSRRMFDTLIPLLADRYHIFAPDYPGFGHSDAPPPAAFAYTFDHLAEVVDRLTEELALDNYVLYLNDYGGPVGFRVALAHPERVKALVIQNALSHEEGLGPAWEIRRAYWKDRDAYEAKVIPAFMSLAGARERHIGSSPHPERYNPDTWTDEFALLSRPGQAQIQVDLFYDYKSNVAFYPKWQAWMRHHKPPMLVVWGKFDPSFAVAGADAYRRDVSDAEVQVLDAGHFALDEQVDEIAAYIRSFLAKQ